MALATPYLMFIGDAPDQLAAKVAIGVVHWRPEWCVGQLRMDGCKADLGIPDMTIEEAVAAGCKTLVVGVANRGGIIPDSWKAVIVQAIEAGMDVASGLHQKLTSIPAVAEAAKTHGRTLTDARHATREFDVASGQARTGRRLLTVGTDVSVGKMFTSLAIEREMKARGMNADFRATGQTGIFIAGDGVSVDAVVADFIAGAAEGGTNLTRSEAQCTIRALETDGDEEEISACLSDETLNSIEDSTIDLLSDQCRRGNNQACDELYRSAPDGSDASIYGMTCANRLPEGTGFTCFDELG